MSPRLHPPPAVRAPRHQARQRPPGRQRPHQTGGLRLLFEAQPRRDCAEQRGCGHARLYFARDFEGGFEFVF